MLEIITSSLPIIFSNDPVYKEIIQRNTIYFDLDNPHDIGSLFKIYILNFKTKNKKLF